jgi:hypothetical protein
VFVRRLMLTVLALVVVVRGVSARASMTVLIGEPYGSFGTMLPVGHAAVYLDRVCADTPLTLRMCRPDEPMGVVVSRYHHLREFDWMASPVMEYLYAVERAEQVPLFVTKELESELRERFRVDYLRTIITDETKHDVQENEWYETAGAALDRRLWGYQIRTTVEQDERFVALMNARPNLRRYRVRSANCANFVGDIVNLYFPKTVKANRIADWGIVTPKQVARSMVKFGKAHPEAGLKVLEIPQVAGTLRRSRPTRGISEFFFKTKRYAATLAVIQPEAVVAAMVTYAASGRFRIGEDAERVEPEFWVGRQVDEVGAVATEAEGSAEVLEKVDRGAQ